MEPFIFPVVDALSILTVVGDVIIALLLVAFLPALKKVHTFVAKNGLWLMLITSLIATLGSLFLSDVAGWTPCKDCWLQRIFMYPQVVLLIIALIAKDKKVAKYILVLSLIGIVLSTHHYIEQIEATFFPPETGLEPCDDTGVSCARTYTFRFGYITIPMMALTVFVLNALGSVIMMKKK